METDFEFRRELDGFWRRKMLECFRRAHLQNLGPGIIISDTILKRIIDYARVRKISSVESLQHEMKWAHASELGGEVIQIIHK